MTNDEKKIIQGAISEMIDSFQRQGAERSLQKEIVSRVKEDTTVTPKIFRKMARTAFNANFSQQQAENEEFETIFQEIVAGE